MKQSNVNKLDFFFNEMYQLDLNKEQIEYIKEQMSEGLEIMTKKEIKQCIQDHIENMGW